MTDMMNKHNKGVDEMLAEMAAHPEKSPEDLLFDAATAADADGQLAISARGAMSSFMPQLKEFMLSEEQRGNDIEDVVSATVKLVNATVASYLCSALNVTSLQDHPEDAPLIQEAINSIGDYARQMFIEAFWISARVRGYRSEDHAAEGRRDA